MTLTKSFLIYLKRKEEMCSKRVLKQIADYTVTFILSALYEIGHHPMILTVTSVTKC